MGRKPSENSVWTKAGANLNGYWYVIGNPVVYTDPSGEEVVLLGSHFGAEFFMEDLKRHGMVFKSGDLYEVYDIKQSDSGHWTYTLNADSIDKEKSRNDEASRRMLGVIESTKKVGVFYSLFSNEELTLTVTDGKDKRSYSTKPNEEGRDPLGLSIDINCMINGIEVNSVVLIENSGNTETTDLSINQLDKVMSDRSITTWHEIAGHISDYWGISKQGQIGHRNERSTEGGFTPIIDTKLLNELGIPVNVFYVGEERNCETNYELFE